MKTRTTWKDRDGRALQRRTLAAINSRVASNGRPATAKALRDTMRAAVHPSTLDAACFYAGTTMREKNADKLFDVFYGVIWATQFPAGEQAARLKEYFEIPKGLESEVLI